MNGEKTGLNPSNRPIYLDYAAGAPLDPQVKAAMLPYLDHLEGFGNPSSTTHRYGWQAQEAIEKARQDIASALGASLLEIFFTSGATESINLALQGLVAGYYEDAQERQLPGSGRTGPSVQVKPHVLTSAVEHKAVLETLDHLRKKKLITLTVLNPNPNGQVLVEEVIQAIQPETVLASFMHVNNELGVINPIKAIAQACQDRQVFLHVDAAQSLGKAPVDLAHWGADLVSFSAHKAYGPKGVGALYVSGRVKGLIRPLFFGGGQERRLRPGTTAVHQVVGMSCAFELATASLDAMLSLYQGWREAFLTVLEQQVSDWHLHGGGEQCVPNIMNIGFDGVDGEALQIALKEVALSSGSACNSVDLQPSHVLMALGIPKPLALASLRISFGRFSSESQLVKAAELICSVVRKLRA